MRNPRRVAARILAVVGFALAGCGESGQTNSAAPPATDETVPSSDADPTTTTAPPTTASPTTLPDPTIFNPKTLGDVLELSSFVLTVAEDHSSNGQPNQRTTTIGYIRDPSSAYVVSDFDEYGTATEYFVDGATYQNNNQGHWYLYANGSVAAPDILQVVGRSDAMYEVISAVFVGEEAFGGVAAYHFTFDETNLQSFSSYTPERPSPEVEGDFFLAKEGNQVLYAHSRQVAAGEGYELIWEYTETLSSVNQLSEIELSGDMLPLKEALDLGASLAIPMPADGVLDSMINYNQGGIGVYYYQFTSTWNNETEFLDYYTTLPPTNGWTVTHIGQVKNLDVYCSDGNCVIIKNGDKQVILYFDGRNLHADYDREHRFSAQ